MRLLTIAAFLTCLFCFQTGNCDPAAAQIFKKHKQDAVVNYQPNDPWTRGKVFNWQTGNSGLFYNCDGEQAKRCSPYICWKQDYEPMFPPLFEPLKIWKDQVDTVRQRIADGSCSDLGCTCADCRRARKNGQLGGCAACQQAARHPRLAGTDASQSPNANSADSESAVVETTTPRPVLIDPNHGSKFGLVRGKMIENEPSLQDVAPVPTPRKQSSVAKRSLLDQLRGIQRR